MAKKIELIAEIGKNFVTTKEEKPLIVLLNQAKKLINAAKESGIKTVKFQVHNYVDEIHPEAKLNSPHFDQDRYNWVKRNSYPAEFWWQIKENCREIGLEFLATPMSREAAILLNEEIGIDRWKIGSGDILDFVMLDYIRDSAKPIILSSGMSSLEELTMSYNYLKEKTEEVSILHCVSQYPCPLESVNLSTITFLKKFFPKAKIGFSDHSFGIEGSLMAVSLGAEIIEKHFTLDRNDWGPDHKVALLPEEMSMLARRIKDEKFLEPKDSVLGVETKYINQEEMKFRSIFRKGLYSSRDVEVNEMFEPDMIYAFRPKMSGSSSSENYPNILGKFATKQIKQYEAIKLWKNYITG